MNKFLIFALIFAFTNCYLKVNECISSNIFSGSVYIDTTNKDYKYNVEFDWTDDDNPKFTVPIKVVGGSISDKNVIPLFINASTIDKFDTGKTIKYSETADNAGDIATILVYDKYPAYYPFDADISDSEISANIKSTEVQANKNDVTQKFIKYFAIAYCSDEKEVTLKRFDNILVTVNNGNYFSTSKILLACLALLFL